MRQIIIKKNRYVDSVTLMSIGDKILKIEGIENAEVQMGTRANQELLKELGYEIPEGTGADDLVMAVTGDTKAHLDIAIQGKRLCTVIWRTWIWRRHRLTWYRFPFPEDTPEGRLIKLWIKE